MCVFLNGTITTIKEACGAGVKNVWAKGAFDKQERSGEVEVVVVLIGSVGRDGKWWW
jgi:hypothetical protein